MMVMVMAMGRDNNDVRRDMMMVVVMMVMAHHNADLGELDLVSRRVGKPCIVDL